jgi:hypothetical protein
MHRSIHRGNIRLHTYMHCRSGLAVCRDVRGNHLTLALNLSKQYVGKHAFLFHVPRNPFVLHSLDLKNPSFLEVKIYAMYSAVTVSHLSAPDSEIDLVPHKREGKSSFAFFSVHRSVVLPFFHDPFS